MINGIIDSINEGITWEWLGGGLWSSPRCTVKKIPTIQQPKSE
jgi:hypothetical protein